MAKTTKGFTITEKQLAEALEISLEELEEIIKIFDKDKDDEWELTENYHFIYLTKILKERLFSEQGAYAIAKYIDEHSPKNLWSIIKEFITRHKEKLRNAFINKKILENSSSLTVRNNRHFLSKKDVVSILCTSHARFNRAFEELKKYETSDKSKVLKMYEDFDDIDGVKYYSLSGLYKISHHLSEHLTVKDRRSWCGAIEVIGRKTFKMLIDAENAKQKRIDQAKRFANKRDGNCCQITGQKHDKNHKSVTIIAHHLYSQKDYPHLAENPDNLITLTQEVHQDFHSWNGGTKKPCTPDDLIKFVNALYPDNYDVILRLNQVKNTLKV